MRAGEVLMVDDKKRPIERNLMVFLLQLSKTCFQWTFVQICSFPNTAPCRSVCGFTTNIPDPGSYSLSVAPLALPLLSFLLPPPPSPLVLLCDLLHGAGRQQRNLPVWNDLSSQHYHPNTPPSTLCYKGLGKLLFLWDMIKEMLPYVHIFYCPVLEQDMPWFTILETTVVYVVCVCCWVAKRRENKHKYCKIVNHWTVLQRFYSIS